MIEFTYKFLGGAALRCERLNKAIVCVLCAALIFAALTGLVGCGEKNPAAKSRVLEGYFDTVSFINDFSGSSDEEFSAVCDEIEKMLAHYHELFDIYNTHEGVTNLAYVNSMAGKGAVSVSAELVDFLEYAKEVYSLTSGYCNVAMGAVLSLWHDARTEGIENPSAARLPDSSALSEAAEHCDINDLVINRETLTVELRDPEMSLDVGAVAKGYAVERIAEWLASKGHTGYALDIGGNLRVVGTKPDGSGWTTGIKNPLPEGQSYVYTFELSDASAVTSGGYERYYTVNGKNYHHIIDKDTALPAEHFASVSVVCRDSGLADALSTALFCMDYDAGRALIDSLDGVRAVWVMHDGSVKNSFN